MFQYPLSLSHVVPIIVEFRVCTHHHPNAVRCVDDDDVVVMYVVDGFFAGPQRTLGSLSGRRLVHHSFVRSFVRSFCHRPLRSFVRSFVRHVCRQHQTTPPRTSFVLVLVDAVLTVALRCFLPTRLSFTPRSFAGAPAARAVFEKERDDMEGVGL